MQAHVYRVDRGPSAPPQTSVEEAIRRAISRANSTIGSSRWFEARCRRRGHIENGKFSRHLRWPSSRLHAGSRGLTGFCGRVGDCRRQLGLRPRVPPAKRVLRIEDVPEPP